MKFKNLTYTLAITLLLFNCSSDSNDDLIQEEEIDPTVITYDGDIKSIISNNCHQCHGSTTDNGAPFSLTTYDQVKSRVDRIIARTNNASNPMPPASAGGQISSGLRAMIQQWKDDGLLEN